MPRRKSATPATPREGYSFADVLVLTEASRSNVIHWTNIGIITPAIEQTAGTGFPRRFSPLNVIEVELCTFVNQFRVPAEKIRGAQNAFRHFHYGAVAMHAQATNAPLVTQPSYLAHFKSLDHRREVARSFVIEQANRADLPAMRTQATADRAVEHAKSLARVWADLRSGGLTQGIPDPGMTDFLGLFVGDSIADVALNPVNLGKVIEGSAIVIDLAEVLWRVGQRCRRLSCPFGEW